MSYNVDINAMAGGLEVYNKGNHAGQGSPHPQYVNMQDFVRIIYVSDLTDVYCKFCTISILGRDANSYTKFTIFNENAWFESIYYATFIVKVEVSGAMDTGYKRTRIMATAFDGMNINNVIGVVTVDDGVSYVVELYLKHWRTSSSMRVQPLVQHTTKNPVTGYPDRKRVKVEYVSNIAAVNALPAGAQSTAEKHFDILDNMRYEIPAQVTINNYVKLFDINLTSSNASKSAIVEIISSTSAAAPYFVKAVVKAKINMLSAGGTTVYGYIVILESSEQFFKTQLVGIITQNDANAVVVSVYLTTSTLEDYEFSVYGQATGGTALIVVPGTISWVASLPAGTAITVTGQKFLYMGTDCFITRDSALLMRTGGGLKIGSSGAWNADKFKIGTFQLWVDTAGRLRIKNGDAANETDGQIVGAQS